MDWDKLKRRLNDLQKGGWSWSVGFAHARYCARLWKDKKGVQKVSWTARQGRHVISARGNDPEDALTKALSRHEEGAFDPDPPEAPPWLGTPEKPKDGPPRAQGEPNP